MGWGGGWGGGVGGAWGADSVRFDFSPLNPKPCRIATSLFGLVLDSAGICRTFVVWSQDGGYNPVSKHLGSGFRV